MILMKGWDGHRTVPIPGSMKFDGFNGNHNPDANVRGRLANPRRLIDEAYSKRCASAEMLHNSKVTCMQSVQPRAKVEWNA